MSSHGDRTIRVISERDTLSALLQVVDGLSGRWTQPWDTPPTPHHAAVFIDRKGATLFVVWLGPRWLMAADRRSLPSRPALVKLHEPEVAKLNSLLGIGV